VPSGDRAVMAVSLGFSAAGERLAHKPPVVAQFVAEIRQQAQGRLRHGQAPAPLGHLIGHTNGEQVDLRGMTAIGELDLDLVGNDLYLHLKSSGTTMFEDVGHYFGGGDPDLQTNICRHVIMARPEGVQSRLDVIEGSRAGGEIQLHLQSSPDSAADEADVSCGA